MNRFPPGSLHSRVERSCGGGRPSAEAAPHPPYGVRGAFVFAESFCFSEVLALCGAGFCLAVPRPGPPRADGVGQPASFPSASGDPKAVRAEAEAEATGARERSRWSGGSTGGESEVMAGVWDKARRLVRRARNRPGASGSGNADTAACKRARPWATRAPRRPS